MSSDTNYTVLRKVLADGVEGWAIEFGVYSGHSLAIIADHMPVIGLDSFEGLPEDWRPGFPKGKFDLSEAPGIRAGFPPPNAMIIPGWFKDTVPLLSIWGMPPFGLVHIDCDLYSSTVTALEGVLPFIEPGTVIVFDEFDGYPGWEQHEAKAWQEFTIQHRVISQEVGRGEQERAFRISVIGDR